MHPPNQFDLLAERRFAPFFWTQFLGAGNDNVYKNALVIFVAYHASAMTSLDANTLVNLAGAVFIFPFMLLSATGGQLADKLEKSSLMRWIKLFEIAIMVVGFAGFWMRDETGTLTRAFGHICWDGCMFPNATMMRPDTWTNVLSTMIAVRQAHGWN